MHIHHDTLRIAEVKLGRGTIGVSFAPGKKQTAGISGSHDRDLGDDLDAIAEWGASVVVTLVEYHELAALQIGNLGVEVCRRHMRWLHLPIIDAGIPDAAFDVAWPGHSQALRSLLARGGRVFVHCRGGIGRAGMVAARLLVEDGLVVGDAIATMRAARGPYAVETEDQERWVAAGRPAPLAMPGLSRTARRDRAVGALLGLAVGDAVGTTLEFTAKPRFAAIDDMVGGGPFGLAPGQWTDDTAMALALADSLLTAPALDPRDLARRFINWRDCGAYSCTGDCFDIGMTISGALARYERSGEPLSGPTAPGTAGNGALMRLAPVAIRHWNDNAARSRAALLQTRVTHGAAEAIRCSAVFADLLAAAIVGAGPDRLFADMPAFGEQVPWRNAPRSVMRGSGYVVHSLAAALWAVSRSTDFRSAILFAANLGEDADTTAAIAGQFAGAVYGVSAIPKEWLGRLAWRERIEGIAAELFDAADKGGI